MSKDVDHLDGSEEQNLTMAYEDAIDLLLPNFDPNDEEQISSQLGFDR